jgi:hypothetical protein
MDCAAAPALLGGRRNLAQSCPRLTIWEDAADGGYVIREARNGVGVIVAITAAGERLLRANGRAG